MNVRKHRNWLPLVPVTLVSILSLPLQAASVDTADPAADPANDTGLSADEVGAEADSWDTAGDSAAEAWDATKGAASDTWKATKESSGEAWDATKEFSSDAWDATKEGSAKAWDATKEGSSKAWDATKEFSAETWESTREFVSGDDASEAPVTEPQADGAPVEQAGEATTAPGETGI